MTKDKALKLALRALERLACLGNGVVRGNSIGNQIAIDALTAIKEALAQPEQPKVRTGNCLRVGVCASEGHKIAPQRTWVSLTDEEIWTVLQFRGYSTDTIEIAKAIEAKLKGKNFD